MFTTEQLEQMRSVDITKVDRTSLANLEDIVLDRDAPFLERAISFFEQVKNPYLYRVGHIAVKVKYKAGGKTLTETVESYLRTIKSKMHTPLD